MKRFDLAPRITAALSERGAEGRTRVVRALLRRPLIDADANPELFRLARLHGEELREWFGRETGWRLTADSQSVRLQMSYVPTGPTATAIAERHPARARQGDPGFTRRRYVLLCLALAVLERSDPQVALGRLADDVVLMARQPGLEQVDFTLGTREERSDLVAVIRLLLGLGVLIRVAGDEESFASGSGDALYDVDRRVLSTMVATPHGPALVAASLDPTPTIDQIEAGLHQTPPAYTDEEANLRLRQSISRRLLCDPVIYYDELPEAERDYLLSGQRVGLARRLVEATGLVAELRAEGIALVDPDDQLTDLRMPEQGTDGHVTLLVAEQLASMGATDVAALRTYVRGLADAHSSYWRKSTREPDAENGLVAAALDRLVAPGGAPTPGTRAAMKGPPPPAPPQIAGAAPALLERKTR